MAFGHFLRAVDSTGVAEGGALDPKAWLRAELELQARELRVFGYSGPVIRAAWRRLGRIVNLKLSRGGPLLPRDGEAR